MAALIVKTDPTRFSNHAKGSDSAFLFKELKMAKIIQISTVPTRAETYENRDGDKITSTDYMIYALTDDGRIWCRCSNYDITEPWEARPWPEPKDGDK